MKFKVLGVFIFSIISAALVFGASFFYFSEVELYRELEHSISNELSAKLAAIQISTQVRIVAAEKEKNIDLIFVGDIMLSRGVEQMVEKYGEGDWRYPFFNVVDALRSADLVFGNLEGPISARGKNQGSVYSFRADPAAVHGLTFAGFDVLSLANNHILDWGREALLDTIQILSSNGIHPVGAGKSEAEANAPLMVNVGEAKIAFLAFTDLYPKSFEARSDSPGVSSFNPTRIKKQISEIKNIGEADIVIVSLHWGEEYKTNANKKQIAIGHKLVDAGADLIIGHHPHVVQEAERYNRAWIAYSLGNFIFDQNFDEATSRGLMLKVIVQNRKIEKVEEIPIKFTRTFQPYL